MKRGLLIVIGATVLTGLGGVAVMADRPIVEAWELTPGLAISETAYKHGDVSRQMLGIEIERRNILLHGLNVAAEVGYIFKAEHSEWKGSGSGYQLGLTTSLAPFHRLPGLAGWLGFTMISEDYGSDFVGVATAEGDATTLTVGLRYTHLVSSRFRVHAGMSAVAVEGGSYQRTVNTGQSVGDDQDMAHDNRLGVEIGAAYEVGGYWVKASLDLVSRTRINAGVGIRF